MAYAPVELRHIRFKRGILGYRREAVDRLLSDVTVSFEAVWRERADLSDRLELVEAELAKYREHESLLHTTLIAAERAAAELKEQAQREAQLIVDEAHSEARTVTREARSERERLVTDARRVRVLLQAALGAIDEADAGESKTEARAA